MSDELIDDFMAPLQSPGSEQPADTTPPLVAKTALSAAAAAALAACGGGDGGSSGSSPAYVYPDPLPGRSVNLAAVATGKNYAFATSNEQAARFLLQAGFAVTEADIAQVRSLGYSVWLQRQIAMNQGVKGWDWLNAQGYASINGDSYYDNTYPADYMAWNQLITCSDTFRKRVALALSEYFVVSVNGLDITWRSHAIAQYWDTLCTHALGNFRDLLEAITLNPAMGFYLNTKGNRRENLTTGRQPDENYAREVMQLFTVGLQMLNMDGSVQTTGGIPIETYSNTDVTNLAKVFTGYDVDMSQNANTVIAQTGGGTRTIPNTSYVRLPMKLTPANRSTSAVSLFGLNGVSAVNINLNTADGTPLTTALNALFNHPNMAPFFAKQMIQRLVTSNPSAAYIQRVANVFVNNGSGVRGDLAFVFSAILLDDEARAPAGLTDTEYGKLREPMLRFVQWARTFGVVSSSGGWRIGDQSEAASRLGQSPLRSPSVFNFFRPGYVPPGTSLSAGKVVPEFQIVNETSVGGYLNFMMDVIDNGLNSGDFKATYATEVALATDPTGLLARLNQLLCAGQLSATTAKTIADRVTSMAGAVTSATTTAINLRKRVCAAVLMVMACPEYLVQK